MTLPRQLLFSCALIVAAAVAWAMFLPGPLQMLGWSDEAAATQGGPGSGAAGGRGPQPSVVTAAISAATINDRLTAIGTGRALSSVIVTPFTSGRLTEFLVDHGGRVEAGDIIARLDSEAEEIALDRARIALDDARARFERINALRASNTATQVQLNDAQIALRNAELAVRDAELSLERRSIVTPISGVVGILPVSAGNYITSQTEVATVDDRSRIVIEFWVPERFAGAIAIGQPVTARAVARPDAPYGGRISALDNRIDTQSRTLRVQASIDNADDGLRAGMSFQVELRLPGDRYPSVDPLAVQWGPEGAFVWTVENGEARRTPVRIVQRNTDSVLVSGDFGTAGAVVIQGVHAVREGAALDIVRGGPGGPQEATPRADLSAVGG